MSKPTFPHIVSNGGPAIAAAGALLVILELARVMRSSLWIGFELSDIAPILAAWLLYGAAAGMLSALAWAFLPKPRRFHGVAVLPFVSAAVVWGALAALTRQLEWGGVTVGLALPCGAGLLVYLLTKKNPARILPVTMAVVPAAVLGVMVAATMHRAFLLDPQIRPMAAWVALGVFGFSWPLLTAAIIAKTRKRRLVGSAAIMAALAMAVWYRPFFGSRATNAAETPNLLLVTSDTLRAGYCSAFGGPVPTPHLESLVGAGAAFDHTYSLAPWTLPSMLGLLSSSYPPSPSPERSVDERCEEIGRYRFPENTPTLAELLQTHGYATAAFVANTLLDDPNGFLRGVDTSIVVGHRTHVQTGFFEVVPLLQQVLRAPFPGLVRPRPVDTTRILTTYASAFMKRNDEPWFVWVHFMDPHTAYDPPDRYRTQQGPWPVFCNADPYWGKRDLDEHGMVELAPEYRDYVRSLYHGEIRYVDEALGDLLGSMTATGAKDRTYVCFTSDHGEEFWDHGNYGHGHSLYDELLHVPLIMAGPGIASQRIPEPFSAIHVVPTVAELLGLPADPAWRGVGVADALRAESPPKPAAAFAQATHPSITDEPSQCVRDGRWKLVRGMISGGTLLFDMENDPTEQRDLSATAIEPLARLTTLLDTWQGSFPATFSAAAAGAPPDAGQIELLQRLRDLGYL